MTDTKKTPFHRHTHAAYGWVALIVSVLVILGVAGWYYLEISDGYNDDLVYSVQQLSEPVSDTDTDTGETISVAEQTAAIDTEINEIQENDFSDTQLDNTILGIN